MLRPLIFIEKPGGIFFLNTFVFLQGGKNMVINLTVVMVRMRCTVTALSEHGGTECNTTDIHFPSREVSRTLPQSPLSYNQKLWMS